MRTFQTTAVRIALLLLAWYPLSWLTSELRAQPTPTPPSSVRTAILVSDTHFGVGEDGGSWHPLEDARWAEEFDSFLRSLTSRQTGPIDLVLLGDTFELWQSRQPDCRYENKNLSCVESEAVGRLARVMANHATEITALRRFAAVGGNQIVLVPGNHDAALLFPAAAQLLADALQPRRFSIARKGYWLSANGRVYAEHGHQIGKDPGRYRQWPTPFIEIDGKKHLQKVWGERFVGEFYDPYEQKYPIVDNITDEISAARLAFAAEGTSGAVRGVKDFLRLMVFSASWAQFKQFLGPGGAAPTWDYVKIRHEGDEFFLSLLEPGDPVREILAAEAGAPGGLGISMSELTNEDLQALCDKQQMRRIAAQRARDPHVPPSCPTQALGPAGGLGAVTEKLMRRRDGIFAEHLNKVAGRLEREGEVRRFDVFVFGHTHMADRGFLPKAAEGGWNPKVINTGAWQRVISPSQVAAWRAEKGWSEKQLLQRAPEELPPCYSFVRVVEGMESTASVMFWRLKSDGTWGESTEDCN